MSTASDQELKPVRTLKHAQSDTTQRKRKKPHVEQLPLLFDAFKIQASNSAALTIEPLRTVAKTAIPLHLFDFAPGNDRHGHNGLFHTCNTALENSFHRHAQDELGILLAQINHTARLAAIERVDQDVYSLTLLRLGVECSGLTSRIAQGDHRIRKFRRIEPRQDAQRQWWHRAAVPCTLKADRHVPSHMSEGIEQAVNVDLEKPPSLQPKPNEAERRRQQQQQQQEDGQAHQEHTDIKSPQPLQTVDSIAVGLVEQYLEALYLSRTSLAYFPKSTLPRARAAVGSIQINPSRAWEFVASLRSMILSPSTFDKKYRQSIPTAIKELSAGNLGSGPDKDAGKERRKKAKKLKKPKPGKSGLYSIETGFLGKWWDDHEVAPDQASSPDHTRSLQTDLRFREILLQIILVLETIALEATIPPLLETQSPTLPDSLDPTSQQVDSQTRLRESKSKKVQNLDAILELLVDRLCIWQSIEAVDIDEKVKETKARVDANTGPQDAPASKDKLKDFCQHVLIPFYGPRLTTKVEELAKRMGVSIQSSPARPPLVKSSTMVLPGTEIRRRPPGTSGRQLQRTNSAAGMQKKPPSLVRSVTDSQLRAETRERSSTPLEQPMKPPRRTLSRASSISSSTKLSQREVDMTAIAKFSQSRRKPSVDTELREAIATLKKPNRGKAVEDYVNSIESKSMPMPKKPWLKSRMDVEVGATPRREQKTRNALDHAPAVVSGETRREDDFPIPSINPNATALPRHAPEVTDSAMRATSSRRRLQPSDVNVFQTPSKRSSGKSHKREEASEREVPDDTVPASTSKSSASAPVARTPMKAARRIDDIVPQSSPPQGISHGQEADLIPPREDKSLQKETVARSMKAAAVPSTSIYKSLGWDDNDDDDDLL